jgi:lysophospholipase L1-like esterase
MNIFQKIIQGFVNTFDMMWGMTRSAAGDPRAWERSILRFEQQDRLHPPPKDAILFTGSSSFTFWTSLEQDMAPLQVINRGFGGSRMDEVVYYADRIVLPYRPRVVVLFAGTNDISGSKPKSAQDVYQGYLAFVAKVHAALPAIPIYYVSITPAPSRWKYWPIAHQANCLIKAHTESDPCQHFIDMTQAVLTPDGMPDRSLYRFDRLHPNQKGYARWTAVIKPVLMKAMAVP